MRTIVIITAMLLPLPMFGQLLRPDPERATLVFFREFPSRFGHECWACNYQLKVNGEKICNLSENRFVVYLSQPGNVILESQPARRLFARRAKGKLVVQTEVNKVYYIRCDQRTDQTSALSRGELSMKLDDEARAIRTLAGMKMDACSDKLIQ